MADYNVNMKQWNGTSFDNVLPLAYNAKNAEALAGSSIGDIQQWVKDNGLLLYTGQYTGTGTYGSRNPTSVTFPFAPSIFFFPNQTYFPRGNVFYGMLALNTAFISSSYLKIRTSYDLKDIYIKKSSDGRTFTWYAESVDDQMNYSGLIYFYSAIGGYDMGGATEFIITESGNFIVPRTGRYMLELYGGGGGTSRSSASVSGYSGGASCQHYDSVSLVAGDNIDIVVGSGVKGQKNGGSTSFGSYSVSGGGGSSDKVAGAGAGNYGAAGKFLGANVTERNYGSGVFSELYGYGPSNAMNKSGDGAVYIKYIGE